MKNSVLRRTISILADNMGLSLKILLYSGILMLIALFFVMAILGPIYNALTNDFLAWTDLYNALNPGTYGGLSGIAESFRSFLYDNQGSLFARGGLMLLVYFLFVFFINLTKLPATKVVYNKMSQSYNERFYHALFSSLPKSLLFSLIYSLISVVLDFIIITFCVLIVIGLNSIIGFFSLTVSAFVGLILLTLKQSIFSLWTPTMVSEESNAFKALKTSFPKSIKNLKTAFVPHFFGLVVMFAIVTSTALFTVGLLPILLMPIYIVFINTANTVTYFTTNNKKFYLYGTFVEKEETDIEE